MYQIKKDGVAVAMTERPTYIKRQENGCFGLCSEAEAEGIAHEGTVYHLLGRPDLDGAETVMLEETDVGGTLGEIQAAVDDLTVTTLMGGTTDV